jgi:hypothetical protein
MGLAEVAVAMIFSGVLFTYVIFPFTVHIDPNIITFSVGAAIGLIAVAIYTGKNLL